MAIRTYLAQLGERLDDALDLDALGPEVLVVLVAHLALPADRLLVDLCRPGLGPRGQSLAHVPEVLVLVHGETDVRQGASPSPVVPELGVHQDAVMVEEDALLHSRDPFGSLDAIRLRFDATFSAQPHRRIVVVPTLIGW